MTQDYYVCPKQADAKWKKAHTMNKTIYIYGVSGSGKTAFIKYQLRNKKYSYLSGKDVTEEDFRIAVKDNEKRIVVVDDLQYLAQQYREKLLRLIEHEDLWVVLAGRSRLPRYLTPLYVRYEFMVIDEENLELSLSEIKKYFSLWKIPVSQEVLQTMYVQLYANGLAMRMAAIEMAKGIPYNQEVFYRIQVQAMDYMEQEVYDTWDIAIQEFFMQVSVVDKFDEKLAEMITGRTDIPRVIEDAMELGNFLDKKGEFYTLRKNMLLAMRRRLRRNYPENKISNFYYNAGLCYELKGQMKEALQMYESGNHQSCISELLIRNARENPASGYYYELKEYYLKLSEDYILDSVELMAGMSMLQAMLLNCEESERWYKEIAAYEKKAVGSRKKVAGNILLYLDIALPQRSSENLIDIFTHTFPLICNRCISLPEFSVTSNLPSLMNGGKDFCEWSKKDKFLADTIGKPLAELLGKYGPGLVDTALAESYFEKGMDNYEVSVYANRGRMAAEASGRIETEFVAIGILTRLHLIGGHMDAAKEVLDGFAQRVQGKKVSDMLLQNLLAMQIRLALYLADQESMRAWMNDAPDEEVEFYALNRYQYLTKIRVYLMLGKNEKAINLCHRVLYYADMMKRVYVRIETNLLLAIAMYRMKDTRWEMTMEEVIRTASEYHFVRLITREGGAVYPLLKALKVEHGKKNLSFFKQTLAETEQMMLAYPGYLKAYTEEKIKLSSQARRILGLQAEGKTAAQIADEIGISEHTVRYHSRMTYQKLGVSDKTAAVMEARHQGII